MRLGCGRVSGWERQPTERQTKGPENHPLHAQTASGYDAGDGSADGKGETAPESNVRSRENSKIQGFPPRQFCLQRITM